MARIVIAGCGSVGACIGYHLALLGARDVVLADRAGIASGSTGKAMGGIRQQFSTAAEVRLARESIAFFEELGPAWFQQVGYLFLATTAEGLVELDARRELQAELGVPVERVDARFVAGLNVDDVLGAVFCATDGVADPPALTREIVRRAAELGVDVRQHTDARDLERDVLVIAAGAHSSEFGVELPIRPLARQLLETEPIRDLPPDLPMVIEAETGFHFRRRDDCLRIAMPDAEPRWGFGETVDEAVFADRQERLAHRYPPAAEAGIAHGWAEASLRLVRDPDGFGRQLREVLADFLERRRRVGQIPEEDSNDGHAGRGSFASSALTRRSTSASSCPKSSRYECRAACNSRKSSSDSSIVCILPPIPMTGARRAGPAVHRW